MHDRVRIVIFVFRIGFEIIAEPGQWLSIFATEESTVRSESTDSWLIKTLTGCALSAGLPHQDGSRRGSHIADSRLLRQVAGWRVSDGRGMLSVSLGG
jgi:hypothetical protein